MKKKEEKNQQLIEEEFIQENIEQIVKMPIKDIFSSIDNLKPEERVWLMVGIHSAIFQIVYLLRNNRKKNL